MQRILLPCNDQKPPGNHAPQYYPCLYIKGPCQRLASLGFSNSKSKSLPFINDERSADESINEYFS